MRRSKEACRGEGVGAMKQDGSTCTNEPQLCDGKESVDLTYLQNTNFLTSFASCEPNS